MKDVKFPESHQQVMPYLILNNATAFLDFTRKVFDAEETYRQMRDEQTIRHAEIRIGESIIMFADSTDQYPAYTTGMFIYVDDADQVYEKALAEGAVGLGEPADQPYGRSGGINDPCGNTWWITSEL